MDNNGEWIDVEGSSREEAEEKALTALGADNREELEVSSEKTKRKFLGVGGKVVTIRVRKKEAPAEEEAPVEEPVIAESVEEEAPPPPPVAKESQFPTDIVTMESKYRPWASKGPAGTHIPKRGRGFSNRLYSMDPVDQPEPSGIGKRDGGPKSAVAVRPAVKSFEDDIHTPYEEREYAPQTYEDAEGSVVTTEARDEAVSFIRTVISNMGLSGDVIGYRLKDRLLIQIGETGAGGLLIGRRGETLDSLQYLVDIIINRSLESRIRVVVDTENYRDRRKLKVTDMSKNMANKANKIQKAVPLPPMTPVERRIVHVTLADDKRVTTRSEGTGARRRVVIHPVGKKGGNPGKKNENGARGGYRKGARD